TVLKGWRDPIDEYVNADQQRILHGAAGYGKGLHDKSDDEQAGNQNRGDAGNGFRKSLLGFFRLLRGVFLIDLFFCGQSRFLVRWFYWSTDKTEHAVPAGQLEKVGQHFPRGEDFTPERPCSPPPRPPHKKKNTQRPPQDFGGGKKPQKPAVRVFFAFPPHDKLLAGRKKTPPATDVTR